MIADLLPKRLKIALTKVGVFLCLLENHKNSIYPSPGETGFLLETGIP